VKVGITKRIGWHTFRHSYSTLLKASGVDIKVMQELLRHASTRVTLDTYTQAVTPAKRAAQTAVVTQFFPSAKEYRRSHSYPGGPNCALPLLTISSLIELKPYGR
jgi:hypothetical protein